MVMNITDIDDKIIIRARRNHLFDVYRGQHNAVTAEVIKDLHESWDNYISKLEKKLAELAAEKDTLNKAEADKKRSKREEEIKAETQLAEEKLAAAKVSHRVRSPCANLMYEHGRNHALLLMHKMLQWPLSMTPKTFFLKYWTVDSARLLTKSWWKSWAETTLWSK